NESIGPGSACRCRRRSPSTSESAARAKLTCIANAECIAKPWALPAARVDPRPWVTEVDGAPKCRRASASRQRGPPIERCSLPCDASCPRLRADELDRGERTADLSAAHAAVDAVGVV